MGNTRIFLEQIDQSGASSTDLIAWNGTKWAPTPAVAGVSDGDKGDITVSSGVWTIDNGVLTLAKMANLAANSIIGNNTGAGATPIALTATQVTAMLDLASGATKGLLSTTDFTKLSNLSGTNTGDQTITLTGNVTGSGTGSFATTIASNVVTNAMLAQVATATFKGRTTASTGNVEDLTATQATALLNDYVGATAGTAGIKGLVPSSSTANRNNFLKGDGTWATPTTAVWGSITGTLSSQTDLNTALGNKLDTSHAGTGGSAHANVVAAGASGFMTGSDKTKLDGIATGATANSPDATLLARANHTGTQAISTILAAASSRFFGRITASGGAGEELTGTQATTLLDLATGSLKGLMSSSDFTKLSGIASGATANSTDAVLLARANHTGTQAVATLTFANTARFAGRNTAGSGTGEELTGTQATALLDVATGSLKGLMSSSDFTKLSGIASGATANQTDSYLLDRANHTGTQAWSTIATPPTTLSGYGITDAIPSTQKGAANGVATLGADSKIPSSQLPAIAITSVSVAANQTAQLALTAQEGDIAVRTDQSKTYIHNGGSAGTMADWTEMLSPTGGVTSVNGEVGVVVLNKAHIGLANVDNTSDADKPVSTATQTALDGKLSTAHAGTGGSAHATVIAGGAAGFMTGTDKTKLDGIATGATANSADATLLARANHTGTQSITTTTFSATARISGRTTSGAGAAEELTATQVTAMLDLASGSAKGLLSTTDYNKLQNLSGTNTGDQTITLTGDVTGSGTGSFATTIGAGKVTLAMQANVNSGTVFYRKTASAGAPEVQTLATLKTDLGLTGTNSGDQTTITGNAGSATVLETSRNFSISGGGITAAAVSFNGSAAVTLSASVDAGHITLARMADVATGTVFYRKTVGTGAPEVQTLATLKTDLGLTGTNSGDQTITLTGNVTGSGTGSFATTIANNVVTNAMLAQVATATFKGRTSASTGNVEDLTTAQATAMLDVFASGLKGLVPSPGTPSGTKYLRDDGTWQTVSAGASSGFNVSAAGTGASQNVTLPSTVSAASEVYVFVNGLLQEPINDYTVSGTTLTITTDNSGDEIYISKPAGSQGDPGTPGANGILGWTGAIDGVMADAETFILGFAGTSFTITEANCKFWALVGATASTVITIKKKSTYNGSPTTIGTATFAAGGSAGTQAATISITSSSVSAGDMVWMEGPATADTTLSGIAYVVRA